MLDKSGVIRCQIQTTPSTFNLGNQLFATGKKYVQKAIDHCGENRKEVTKLLGIRRKTSLGEDEEVRFYIVGEIHVLWLAITTIHYMNIKLSLINEMNSLIRDVVMSRA